MSKQVACVLSCYTWKIFFTGKLEGKYEKEREMGRKAGREREKET